VIEIRLKTWSDPLKTLKCRASADPARCFQLHCPQAQDRITFVREESKPRALRHLQRWEFGVDYQDNAAPNRLASVIRVQHRFVFANECSKAQLPQFEQSSRSRLGEARRQAGDRVEGGLDNLASFGLTADVV
jgi:hypothetical protein